MRGLASKSELRMSLLRYALFTVPGILLLGTLSGRLANSGYGNVWFDALQKPSFMPPGWTFGVAWTLLYILLGLVLAMLLHARGARGRGLALTLFGVQMALNYSWSPLFFAAHQVDAALVVLVGMVVLTIALMVVGGRIRRTIPLLLAPYLAWLCFAGALNYEIGRLNPDAATLAPTTGSTDIAL